jgi:hypothetical protein
MKLPEAPNLRDDGLPGHHRWMVALLFARREASALTFKSCLWD